MTELAFFLGKGGVGKTTVSTAYAMYVALRNPAGRVLLLSTDPAHSLSDILQLRLGNAPSSIRMPVPAKLFAWQANAPELFGDFLDQHKKALLDIVERGSIFSREDIEPLIDTAFPGMAEIAALLALQDALGSGEYDAIVVDTAPFGHTLRLFGLPENFLRFLDFLELAASRDRILAEHFGGRIQSVGEQLLADWRSMAEGLQHSLTEDARLFLVTTPEKFSLNESLRCAKLLRSYSPPLKFSALVLNRAVVGRHKCEICRRKADSTRAARTLLGKEFPGIDLYMAEDPGGPILGIQSLRRFGEHVFSRARLQWIAPTPRASELSLKRAQWPVLDVPLSLVLGKGGVGKTTISAALGFQTRRKAHKPVEICSVDPAPSLDDVFQKEVGDQPTSVLGDPQFRASELDSISVFQSWVAEVKATIDAAMKSEYSGIHWDLSFERELFTHLLESVPPGVDEVLAIFRILDLLSGKAQKVVIDMAPTGHALELLRMPERILAWSRVLLKTLAVHRKLNLARDAGVKVAELAHHVRELSSLLKDSGRAHIYTVMLAEPLPDRETERLMEDLRGMHLRSAAIFMNRVLFSEDIGDCRRCRRSRQWQLATLGSLKRRYGKHRVFVVRNFPSEISGKSGLRALTGELWQLA